MSKTTTKVREFLYHDVYRTLYSEWFSFNPRARARLLLSLSTAFLLSSGAAFVYDLWLGHYRWTTALYGLSLLAATFCLLVYAAMFASPYKYPPHAERIAALKERDLDLLELLLSAGGEVNGIELYQLTEDQSWPNDFAFVQGCWHDRELLASLKSLRRAGLIEDLRGRYYEEAILPCAVAEAGTLLEDERERRGRVAPLGPRSRPGPLSA